MSKLQRRGQPTEILLPLKLLFNVWKIVLIDLAEPVQSPLSMKVVTLPVLTSHVISSDPVSNNPRASCLVIGRARWQRRKEASRPLSFFANPRLRRLF